MAAAAARLWAACRLEAVGEYADAKQISSQSRASARQLETTQPDISLRMRQKLQANACDNELTIQGPVKLA